MIGGSLRLIREEVDEDEVGVARIAAARRCSVWRELDGPLVRRGPWWVDAATDRLFTPYRGQVFAPGSASIAFADTTALVFTVDGDRLTLYEPVRSPATWSEHVTRRARRQAAAW